MNVMKKKTDIKQLLTKRIRINTKFMNNLVTTAPCFHLDTQITLEKKIAKECGFRGC